MGPRKLFLFGVILSVACAERWQKLNTAPVCYSTWNDQFGEFQAAIDAEVEVIRLVHRSGIHECENNAGGYFGCEYFVWSMLSSADPNSDQSTQANADDPETGDNGERKRVKRKSDFQIEMEDLAKSRADFRSGIQHHQIDTSNPFDGPGSIILHSIFAFLTDGNNSIIAPRSPATVPSYHLPGILRPAWDSTLDIIPNNPPHIFKQGDTLRMWQGDDLNDESEDDNGGNMCIDILVKTRC